MFLSCVIPTLIVTFVRVIQTDVSYKIKVKWVKEKTWNGYFPFETKYEECTLLVINNTYVYIGNIFSSFNFHHLAWRHNHGNKGAINFPLVPQLSSQQNSRTRVKSIFSSPPCCLSCSSSHHPFTWTFKMTSRLVFLSALLL